MLPITFNNTRYLKSDESEPVSREDQNSFVAEAALLLGFLLVIDQDLKEPRRDLGKVVDASEPRVLDPENGINLGVLIVNLNLELRSIGVTKSNSLESHFVSVSKCQERWR